MHVAVIFSHIGPYHLARLQAAYQSCQAMGWELTVIQSIGETSDHPWGELPAVEGINFKTLVLETAPDSEKHPDSSAAVTALSPCLDEVVPDAVAIPGWGFSLSRVALKWCRQHNKPAVLMSESKRDDDRRTWWKEQIKSWFYVRKFASGLVGGPAHFDYLKALGLPADRIFYGYNAVDNNYFKQQSVIARQNPAAARAQALQIPDKPYFLSVTRLIPRKNMVRLIEAFSAYCNQVGREQAWSLVVCGSGSDLPTIQKIIAQNSLEHLVHLPGFLTYQQIGYWYGLAGAFIHPAIAEQWGLVVNEACAAGLPILCSKTVGACQSLVKDGKNGFSFDPQQTKEIAQAMVNVHSLSPLSRLEMGQASQQIVDNFGPKQFGEGLVKAVRVATQSAS